jgi:dihydrofolate reductase
MSEIKQEVETIQSVVDLYFSVVLASSTDGTIGVNQQLPWNIPEDLKRFQTLTKNSCLIMGYNTALSMPYSVLSGRVSIVVTSRYLVQGVQQAVRDKVKKKDDLSRLHFVPSLAEGLKAARDLIVCAELKNIVQVFVIGGKRLLDSFVRGKSY